MVTFWLLIDTIAMIGSPAARGAAASVVCSGRAWRGAASGGGGGGRAPRGGGAAASVVCSGRAWRGAASAGGAAVSAVRAAVAASVTIAGGAHRRTTSVDWALVHRLVMPCPVSGEDPVE